MMQAKLKKKKNSIQDDGEKREMEETTKSK